MSAGKRGYDQFLDNRAGYSRIADEVICTPLLSLTDKMVLIYLISVRSDWDRSHAYIAKKLATSVRTVQRSLKRLEALGMVTISRTHGEICHYEVENPLNWKQDTSVNLTEDAASSTANGTVTSATVTEDAASESGNLGQIDVGTSANLADNIILSFTDSNINIAQSEKEPPAVKKKTAVVKFDLDAIYKFYPRKVGKSRGMEKLEKLIKSQQTYDDMMKAVKNYAAKVEREGRAQEFIKQFNTFVAIDWKDYIEEEPGTYEEFRDWK